MKLGRGRVHVAAGCDGDNVRVTREFLERDGAVHAAAGVAVVPDIITVIPKQIQNRWAGVRTSA